MFGTGGGEAVDFAIKLARGSTGRPRIVSSVNGYHGHTGFALSAAGREAFRQPFEPLMPEFVQVPFGDPDVLAVAVDERTAAVLLEPVQGEGGIVMPPPGYLAAASRSPLRPAPARAARRRCARRLQRRVRRGRRRAPGRTRA